MLEKTKRQIQKLWDYMPWRKEVRKLKQEIELLKDHNNFLVNQTASIAIANSRLSKDIENMKSNLELALNNEEYEDFLRRLPEPHPDMIINSYRLILSQILKNNRKIISLTNILDRHAFVNGTGINNGIPYRAK